MFNGVVQHFRKRKCKNISNMFRKCSKVGKLLLNFHQNLMLFNTRVPNSFTKRMRHDTLMVLEILWQNIESVSGGPDFHKFFSLNKFGNKHTYVLSGHTKSSSKIL